MQLDRPLAFLGGEVPLFLNRTDMSGDFWFERSAAAEIGVCAESSLPRSQVNEWSSSTGIVVIAAVRASFIAIAPKLFSAGPFLTGGIVS